MGGSGLPCFTGLAGCSNSLNLSGLPKRRQKCFQTALQGYFRAPAGSERFWSFLARPVWPGWVDVASVVWLAWLAAAICSTWPGSPTVVKRVSRKLSQRSSESKRKARFPFHVYTGFARVDLARDVSQNPENKVFGFRTLFWGGSGVPFWPPFGTLWAPLWHLWVPWGTLLGLLGPLGEPLGRLLALLAAPRLSFGCVYPPRHPFWGVFCLMLVPFGV